MLFFILYKLNYNYVYNEINIPSLLNNKSITRQASDVW